ncbi:hypothetical protein Tco_1461160, partial [Tanacetum coccineum]
HDLDDVDLVDALDLENKIKKLEKDFSRLLKAKKAKEAKDANEAKLKVNKEVVVLSIDEDVACFNDVKYTLTDVEIRMFKERPTTSRAPTTYTSNAQAASTSAPKRRKIAMTRCVLDLRALDYPTSLPPLAT